MTSAQTKAKSFPTLLAATSTAQHDGKNHRKDCESRQAHVEVGSALVGTVPVGKTII